MFLWEVSAVPEFTNLSPELFQKSGVLPGLVPPPAHLPVGVLLVQQEGVKN